MNKILLLSLAIFVSLSLSPTPCLLPKNCLELDFYYFLGIENQTLISLRFLCCHNVNIIQLSTFSDYFEVSYQLQ